MKALLTRLPMLVTLTLIAIALWHGPVAQLPDYHHFADQTTRFRIPHFADVASNLGFALVAVWGWFAVLPARRGRLLRFGWPGYRLFLIGLFLTALGSAYYHLAPDNARLVWDRLPITLACAGLLAGVWGDTHGENSAPLAWVLGLGGCLSVAWWVFTEQAGAGDLRPYLLLQGLPIVLVPLWQGLGGTPQRERLIFGSALACYIIAKLVELNDHGIARLLGCVTGHTLKHALAVLAAALIVAALRGRQRALDVPGARDRVCHEDARRSNSVSQ